MNKPTLDYCGIRSPSGKRRWIADVVFLVWLVGFMYGAVSIIYMQIYPLRVLGVSFPSILFYSHWIISVAVIVIWLLLRRRFPWRSLFAAILFSFGCLVIIAEYADRQVVSLYVKTPLTLAEQEAIHSRFAVQICVMTENGRYRVCFPRINDTLTHEIEEYLTSLEAASP